ncbi:hypothetical protein [Aporhodopirellula aestuarii]|uniref:Histidine kinase/HSP90-like ATPase domain-containing protein n=1 Tax=Aporhodopirellula aestuarii TaxID=2950107 RepID=A0ABT0TYL7_9BACT|nr:hypothetical protein [Aporhodopirellula aestuarii]MCM2369474.1 hypothetical protein [Aporhodopirellula aestuarii]
MKNCEKHKSKSLTLELMRIRYNGSGIGTDDPSTEGMGVRTMIYRAHLIHGELDVRPLDGGGTEVLCMVLSIS